MRFTPNSILLPTLLALSISGCGGGGTGQKSASQVAARVNGDEISVHQINLLLSQQPPASPEQAKTATPQMLERLIDQQLLVQKAIKSNLDRDPQVMQRIEAAKSQILSQTYLERMSATSDKATPEDIRNFYKENPALFAERRVYRFDEIVVQASAEKAELVEQTAKKSKTVAEMAGWLKSQNLPFTVNSAVRAAEQLPMEMLPQLSRMKDGEILALRGNGSVTVLQLAASQSAAIDDQQASQYIQTFLLNRRRKEIATAEMSKLRAAAKVEYVGEFEKTKPTPGTGAAPAPGTTASPEQSPKN